MPFLMGSLVSPKTWAPTYLNSKDCSQGFCSLYCPQWCYIIHPPPPPPPLNFPDDNSSPNFSPLMVAIIGILASAFLLVSYYTIISKYCGSNMDQRGRSSAEEDDYHENNSDEEFGDNHNPSIHEAWHVATSGLDEALIKSITVCKYRKGDGLVEGTDCSVCLSEFQEDESVRLLPKCSHAFHLQCIDTWLRSHSNCPLCRANIVVCVNPATERSFSSNESTAAIDQDRSFVGPDQTSESHVEESDHRHSNTNGVSVVPKTTTTTTSTAASSLRAFSDLGNLEERHSVIDIRRSVSMDLSGGGRVSVADILRMNNHGDEEEEEEEGHVTHDQVEGCAIERASCSKLGEVGKDSIGHRKGILHCVMSPVAMKRTVSSGRVFPTRPSGCGRGRHNVIPL